VSFLRLNISTKAHAIRCQSRWSPRIFPYERWCRLEPRPHQLRSRLLAQKDLQEGPGAIHDESGADGQDRPAIGIRRGLVQGESRRSGYDSDPNHVDQRRRRRGQVPHCYLRAAHFCHVCRREHRAQQTTHEVSAFIIRSAPALMTGLPDTRHVSVKRLDLTERIPGVSSEFTNLKRLSRLVLPLASDACPKNQFIVCEPEKSPEMLDMMLENSKEFYESLELPYRVVNIVSGALNNAAAIKYDLEAWFPYQGEYKELVSCSNCTDYRQYRFPSKQTRLTLPESRSLNVRFGYKKGEQKVGFVHMLNGTLCATERALCCLVENFQTPEVSHAPFLRLGPLLTMPGSAYTKGSPAIHAGPRLPAVHCRAPQIEHQQQEEVVALDRVMKFEYRGDRFSHCRYSSMHTSAG
jgi:hypothetical protein